MQLFEKLIRENPFNPRHPRSHLFAKQILPQESNKPAGLLIRT
jgi:hypothetical protein